MRAQPRPPSLARRVAALIVRDDRWRDVALGDLDEEFNDLAARRSPGAARLWYWAQVGSLTIDRLKQIAESFVATHRRWSDGQPAA